MEILLIGGTRFVGNLLVWRLLAAGHRVSLLNRGTRPDSFGNRVERLRADRSTNDFQRLVQHRRFDAVVDFAAYTGEDAQQVVQTFGNGRVGHYIVISTGQVYLVRHECPRPAKESDYDGPLIPEPSEPWNREEWLYGVEKRRAEDVLVEAWAEKRFPSTRLRIPMVNGERDHFRRIESYVWRILDGGPLLLPDDGAQYCRHVYGYEVANAICRLLGAPVTFGKAYNLCQDEEPTLRQLLTMLAQLIGAPPRFASVSSNRLAEAGLRPIQVSPFSDSWMSRLDPALAKTELGFQHQPLEQYLDKIVSSLLAHFPTTPPENYVHRPTELRLAAV